MHRLIISRRLLWLSLASATLVGCASVGPDFKTPSEAPAERYTHAPVLSDTASAPTAQGAAQSFSTEKTVATDWWTAFGSAKLDDLIAQALHNSPTLASAEATLRQAQQNYKAQSGSTLYPKVSARLGASRNDTNSANIGQNGESHIFNLYNANIDVTYNLDLFGGNRRSLEAYAAQADYQGFQLAGARLTLAGNVVTTAISQAQFTGQIEATEAILQAQQAQLDIARKRLELGATAKLDVLSLQTQVEQTRASLPPLHNKLEQADHLLAVLIGKAPGAADIPRFKLSDFTLPTRLPVVVPSELLRQRPDIQASTALLHVATAQYGVAIADVYPQINLSAGYGSQALTTGALFGPSSVIWNLAGQLAQPLFNAGLKAGTHAAEANMQAVGADYQQTVLTAFRNVADALRQLDNDALTLQAQAAADASAQASLDLTDQQNKLGAVSYLQLLTAQQQAQQARIGLISAQAARLADSAALYQAMGGGVLTGDISKTANATR